MVHSCPLCRCERAYADTTALKCLDDFLTTIALLLNHDHDQDTHDTNEEELSSVALIEGLRSKVV